MSRSLQAFKRTTLSNWWRKLPDCANLACVWLAQIVVLVSLFIACSSLPFTSTGPFRPLCTPLQCLSSVLVHTKLSYGCHFSARRKGKERLAIVRQSNPCRPIFLGLMGGRCGSALRSVLGSPVQIKRRPLNPSTLTSSDDKRHDPTKSTPTPCESSYIHRGGHRSAVTLQPNSNTRAAGWQLRIHLLSSALILPIRPRPLEHLGHSQRL
jgi:hypothetical protein